MTCLGDVVAALVDGELDHAARERAQRHLAHCSPCRAEVEGQRRLKSRLTGTAVEPAPSDALTARLLALRAEVVRPLPAPSRPPSRPAGRSGPRAARPPRRRRGLRRTAAVGSALAVLGVALALGGTPTTGPTTPVDPGTPAFVGVFVSSTSGQPTSTGGTRSQR